jgi:hypothetical protein
MFLALGVNIEIANVNIVAAEAITTVRTNAANY